MPALKISASIGIFKGSRAQQASLDTAKKHIRMPLQLFATSISSVQLPESANANLDSAEFSMAFRGLQKHAREALNSNAAESSGKFSL